MMIILFLSLTITLRNGLALDLIDIYKPTYSPNIPNEDTQTIYTDSPDTADAIEKPKNMLYDDILHLLHNEKSNKMVLASIHKKGTETEALEENLDDPIRLRRNDNNLEDSTEENLKTIDENLVNLKRYKRNALKWLKTMFHGNTTAPPPKNKSVIPLLLRQSHEINVNSTFTDIIANLTESIKILNRNLMNLKVQASNDAYIAIRMPLRNLQNYVEHEDNATRQRREVNDTELVDTSKEVKPDNDTTLDITEKDIITVNEAILKQSNVTVRSDEAVKFNDTEVNNTVEINANVTQESNALTDAIDETKEINTNITTEESANLQPDTINSKALRAYMLERDPIQIKNTIDREALLMFIDEAYNDIKQKILPIQNIKDKYSQETMYKVGYIIGNLETMEVSLNKLMDKLMLNKDVWQQNRLRRVVKKMTLSKNLVDNIMNYLHDYAGTEYIAKK